MFQFPGFPCITYLIQLYIHGSSPCVFPHSEICGSKLICSSPQLIAACHVLRRLPMPRHSPCALSRLNSFVSLGYNCSLAWIAVFHIYSYLVFFASGKIVSFYPPERPDFFNLVFSLCFLLCLFVCCYHSPFRVHDNSTSFYSVFNELSPAFNRLLRYQPFPVNTLKPS